MIAAGVTRPLWWVRDGLLFLVEVLFLVGVVRGWVGKPLGIYELVHAERPAVRFVNGLVLGLAVGNCLFVLYAVNQEGVPCSPCRPAGRSPRGRISQPAVEFFRLFPEARTRFALNTAVRLSATFPYISPAVNLPTAPARRVVDAGFFDNYGVGLAAGWLLRHRRLGKEYCGGVAIIAVRAFPLGQEKTDLPDTLLHPGGGLLTSVLAGVSPPAEAIGVVQIAGPKAWFGTGGRR